MRIKSKERPGWYQVRWKLSNFIVKIAKWIYPENPEVMAYYMNIIQEAYTEMLINGTAGVEIKLKKMEGR